MNPAADLPLLWRLARGMPRGADHGARLEAFYGPQAGRYDAFRERLLHGRRETLAELAARLPENATLVELGGGTGQTLDFLGAAHSRLACIWIVDLCPSLLAQAERRCLAEGWRHVRTVRADACTWRPPAPIDAVLFSYSLTMIPDWFAAVDNARAMLRPGGLLASVDFHAGRVHPEAGLARHGAWTRWFWRLWFAHDGVNPSPDHLPYLRRACREEWRHEGFGRVPWLAGLRAPWYGFVGRK